MRWSIDGQTAEFLAVTRMISLDERIVKTILGQLRLSPGMNVLDVGCGSGEYCFRLGSLIEGVHFTGIDLDSRFIDFASERANGTSCYPFETPNPANDYSFTCGDGLCLPFESDTFDAVVSHTYLTAVPDWRTALSEMLRVCKPGGTVSSVTSMTDNFYGTGVIELFSTALSPEEQALHDRVAQAKDRTFHSMNLIAGIAPRLVPSAFAQAGLEAVRCTPIGQYFCLSDSATPEAAYRRYVDLLSAMEFEELDRLGTAIADDDRNEYAQLVNRRCSELLAHMGDNHEWDWFGNASLLVCGMKPGGSLTI